jgi:hypothetical protein
MTQSKKRLVSKRIINVTFAALTRPVLELQKIHKNFKGILLAKALPICVPKGKETVQNGKEPLESLLCSW